MYYSISEILKTDSQYNIIIGQRSNGKTYSTLDYCLKRAYENNEQFCYLRRYDMEVVQGRISTLFTPFNVLEITNGEWDSITTYQRKFYWVKYNEKGDRKTKSKDPIGFALALTNCEHDKGTAYPNVTNIIFDEFISRDKYLNHEFALLMNVLSTIIRARTNVKIFMLGNTVNKFCPYFNSFGLHKIKEQKQGTIDIYKVGQSNGKIAVEYCAPLKNSTTENSYFCFDNPTIKMINSGTWETGIHPVLEFTPQLTKYDFYINFDGDILRGDVQKEGYIYFQKCDKLPEKKIVFQLQPSINQFSLCDITKPFNNFTAKIAFLVATNKVFFDSNESGEVFMNYLNELERD